MIYIVYFGVDKKPNKKDVAIKTTDKKQAETQLNNLKYLGFNNAYILETKDSNNEK